MLIVCNVIIPKQNKICSLDFVEVPILTLFYLSKQQLNLNFSVPRLTLLHLKRITEAVLVDILLYSIYTKIIKK